MDKLKRRDETRLEVSSNAASGGDSGSSLLPMLIFGLAFVVIGAIVVMYFF